MTGRKFSKLDTFSSDIDWVEFDTRESSRPGGWGSSRLWLITCPAIIIGVDCRLGCRSDWSDCKED